MRRKIVVALVLGAVALAISLSIVLPSAGAKAAAAKVTAPRWIVVSVHYSTRGNVRLDTQTGQAWQWSADQDGNFIWWPFTTSRPLAAAKAPGVWQISWDSFSEVNAPMLYSNQTGECYVLDLGRNRGTSSEILPKLVYTNSQQ